MIPDRPSVLDDPADAPRLARHVVAGVPALRRQPHPAQHERAPRERLCRRRQGDVTPDDSRAGGHAGERCCENVLARVGDLPELIADLRDWSVGSHVGARKGCRTEAEDDPLARRTTAARCDEHRDG